MPRISALCAGMWIVHSGILMTLQALAHSGLISDRILKFNVCCIPLTSVYMIAGICTFLGRMPFKFAFELFGIFFGLLEILGGSGLSFNKVDPEGAVTILAGTILMLACLISMYDIDAYERWEGERQLYRDRYGNEE